MARCHEETLRADHRESAAMNRTIDRHVLTNHRARTDVNARGCCSIKLQVLRISTEYCKRMHHDTLAQNAMLSDDSMRLDLTPFSKLRASLNDRGRMNRSTHIFSFSSAELHSGPETCRAECP